MAATGLKNIHVALLTETGGVVSYGAPKKIAEAITANVTPNVESAILYGDDRAVETEEVLSDIDVEINITDLSAEDYAFLMGSTVDANNGVTDSINDTAPYVALGFEIPLTKGGKRVFWYYKGKFQLPSSEHTTKQGTTEFQTPTIAAKFLPREDGKWRYRVDANTTNTAVVSDWFADVQEAPTP